MTAITPIEHHSDGHEEHPECFARTTIVIRIVSFCDNIDEQVG